MQEDTYVTRIMVLELDILCPIKYGASTEQYVEVPSFDVDLQHINGAQTLYMLRDITFK